VFVNSVVAEHYMSGIFTYTLLSTVRNYNNMELSMREYGIIYDTFMMYVFHSNYWLVLLSYLTIFEGCKDRLHVRLYSAVQAIVNCKTENCNKTEVQDPFLPGYNSMSLSE
jgi:hypothetical protein